MNLFSETEQKNIASAAPLAVRMRPQNLDQFIGQESFISQGKLLWRMLKADRVTSLIFYGPPGTGKTTLANVIAAVIATQKPLSHCPPTPPPNPLMSVTYDAIFYHIAWLVNV